MMINDIGVLGNKDALLVEETSDYVIGRANGDDVYYIVKRGILWKIILKGPRQLFFKIENNSENLRFVPKNDVSFQISGKSPANMVD